MSSRSRPCKPGGEGESAKELKNVASGDLGLETEDEKKAAEDATKENEAFSAP